MPNPVTAYAESVIAGRIVAGMLVRLACERHLRDLERKDIRFDEEKALRAIKFFGCLRLTEGAFDGLPFKLEPFQEFIIGSMFGWMGSDGWRRFRTAYCEIAKGNGKSPLAGGTGLYGLTADGEAGAEVYSAATTRDQAGILFRDAKNLAEKSPVLRKRLDIGLYNIAYQERNSFFRPVSSEHRGLDGKRPHMALIDEVHEHPNAMVVDKMRAGTKGRRQALIFEITNSGYDTDSVCWHHHEYSVKVLQRMVDDDSWFAFICQLDPCDKCRGTGATQPTDGCVGCDDWRDESVWPKANPGLGTIITEKYLREQVREAVGMPSKENIVKRLNFCVWTKQATRWLNMERWDECGEPFDLEELKGRECFIGLDLASTTDTASLVAVFPVDDWYAVLPFIFVPENAAKERERTNRTRFDGWIHKGLMIETPGDIIDYDIIREKFAELNEVYQISGIAIDRWNATQLATQLTGEGYNVVAFGQGFASMSAPSKELEGLVLSRRLRHGGHPVLRWMAGNAAAEQDAAGNIKPSKRRSSEKIDAVVGLVMAIGLATANPQMEYVPGMLTRD